MLLGNNCLTHDLLVKRDIKIMMMIMNIVSKLLVFLIFFEFVFFSSFSLFFLYDYNYFKIIGVSA